MKNCGLVPGLVSVSFRQLPAEEIVRLCAECGLEAVEWGGDIHVPHGDCATAEKVSGLTEAAGLRTAAYGSYYRCGVSAPEEFARVVACARVLQAPLIRVWAGDKGSMECAPQLRLAVAADLKRCVELAGESGIRVGMEFHCGTLTDSLDSCLELLDGCPGLCSGWQPSVGREPELCREEIRRLDGRLSTVHAFQWRQAERLPFADGIPVWRSYLETLAGQGRPLDILMEFVRNDSPEQLRADAPVLRRLLEGLGD